MGHEAAFPQVIDSQAPRAGPPAIIRKVILLARDREIQGPGVLKQLRL